MRRILLLLAVAALTGCATWKDSVNRESDRQIASAVPLPPDLVMAALVTCAYFSYSNCLSICSYETGRVASTAPDLMCSRGPHSAPLGTVYPSNPR